MTPISDIVRIVMLNVRENLVSSGWLFPNCHLFYDVCRVGQLVDKLPHLLTISCIHWSWIRFHSSVSRCVVDKTVRKHSRCNAFLHVLPQPTIAHVSPVKELLLASDCGNFKNVTVAVSMNGVSRNKIAMSFATLTVGSLLYCSCYIQNDNKIYSI